MRMTKDELKEKVSLLPDYVKTEIICGVAWDAYGDLDEDEEEYIETTRRPDSEEVRTAIEYLHAEVFMREHTLTVKRVVRSGELEIEPGHTMPEIIELAAACLDSANSWDICGEVLFEGDDGQFYVGCVEFVIGPAAPEYLKETLAEEDDEQEEDNDAE